MGIKELFNILAVIAWCGPVAVLSYIPSQLKASDSNPATLIDSRNYHYLPDVFLRELVDRLGKDVMEPSDPYIDPMVELPSPSRLALIARASKDLENEQFDYDGLLEGNPSPSLRDQEYLQHSTLWGNQYISGGGDELPSVVGKHPIKTDAGLPAYCNPPNPCPVGYTSEQGCLDNFENTAAYSREYQAAQDCMCDDEHMFGCTDCTQKESNAGNEDEDDANETEDLETFLAQQYHHGGATNDATVGNQQKNMLAKKQRTYATNPYLHGEKLPIAAKKGLNIHAN